MDRKYNVFLVSDSTGETLDRIFLALKAQFENFNNNLHHFFDPPNEAEGMSFLLISRGKMLISKGKMVFLALF